MKLKKIMLTKTALLLLIITNSWSSEQNNLVPDQDQEIYNSATEELEIATQKTSDYESDSKDQVVPNQKKKENYSRNSLPKKLRTYSTEQRVPDYKD